MLDFFYPCYVFFPWNEFSGTLPTRFDENDPYGRGGMLAFFYQEFPIVEARNSKQATIQGSRGYHFRAILLSGRAIWHPCDPGVAQSRKKGRFWRPFGLQWHHFGCPKSQKYVNKCCQESPRQSSGRVIEKCSKIVRFRIPHNLLNRTGTAARAPFSYVQWDGKKSIKSHQNASKIGPWGTIWHPGDPL